MVLRVSIILLLAFAALLSAPAAQGQQSSFSISDQAKLQTATSSKGFYLLQSKRSNKCSLNIQVARLANYSWSGWRGARCLRNGKKNTILTSGEPRLLVDPGSKRVYVLVSYVQQDRRGKKQQVVEAIYSPWNVSKWRRAVLARRALRGSVYDPGAVGGAVYGQRLWVAFQQPSANYRQVNYPFYLYSYNRDGSKRLSKNITSRPGKRLEIDGKYSALKNNPDAFQLLGQGGKVTLFWTLQRANGQQLGYRAAISNLGRPKLNFLGESEQLLVGEVRSPDYSVYGFRELSFGDNGRHYLYETLNITDFDSGVVSARYRIYRFDPSAASFVPGAEKTRELGLGWLSTSLLSVGFGVDSQGNQYLAEGANSPGCQLTNYYRYQCWDWRVPEFANDLITVDKFAPGNNSQPLASSQLPIPRYGQFRPESRLLQWVDSDVGVRRITAVGGLKIISALGQEGTSNQGAITPRVENRIFQFSAGLP